MIQNLLLAFIISTSLSVFSQEFCIPEFSSNGNHIENFSFHTIENTYSLAQGYTFYDDESLTATVSLGGSYPLTFSTETPAGTTCRFAAWIDYNGDYIFSEDEQILYDLSSSYSTHEQIIIPSNSNYVGERRLRVMSTWNQNPTDPCGSYSYGEVEDYRIIIASEPQEEVSYCAPFISENFSAFMIDDFEIGDYQNNDSGFEESGYVFYEDEESAGELMQGGTYPVFISKGITSGVTGGFAIWLDLNGDGEFIESERLYAVGDGLLETSGFITIPYSTEFYGQTRLRVRSEWHEIPSTPCGLNEGGETEDYTFTIVEDPLGLNERNDKLSLNVFPNPASEKIHLDSNLELVKVELFTLLGQSVLLENDRTEYIDVQELERGLYLLKAQLSNGAAITERVQLF